MKKRILSALMALLMTAALPAAAFAQEYDLAIGSVEVSAGADGKQYVTQTDGVQNELQTSETVITQTGGGSTANTVTINAEANQTAEVTIKDVDISASGDAVTINAADGAEANVTLDGVDIAAGNAAVSTTGKGDVTVELDNSNEVRSGRGRAGLEKNSTGELTITDTDSNGSLDATGGYFAAGIGGKSGSRGSNITITGGTVTATSKAYGAGIGGGDSANGSNITITGGTVTATSGESGAGIGGGEYANGSDITISGGTVIAASESNGAGIGGGGKGSGSNITITGGTVTATGGKYGGAGIGGGKNGSGTNITITGGEVTAKGGTYYYSKDYGGGAGIGGGGDAGGSDITISGGKVKATGGYYASGIGNSRCTDNCNITISGGDVTAIGGYNSPGIGSAITAQNGNGVILISGGKITAKCGKNHDADIGQGFETSIDYITVIIGTGADIDEATRFAHKANITVSENKDGTYTVTSQTEGVVVKGIKYGSSETVPTRPGTYPVTCELKNKTTYSYVFQIGELVIPEPEPADDTQSAPLYRVTDRNGNDIAYTAGQQGGVLTITADADFAVLTGTLRGINILKRRGVEKIVFVTNDAASAFTPADLLERSGCGDTYRLTHDGAAVTFTLGAAYTDVSDILEKVQRGLRAGR